MITESTMQHTPYSKHLSQVLWQTDEIEEEQWHTLVKKSMHVSRSDSHTWVPTWISLTLSWRWWMCGLELVVSSPNTWHKSLVGPSSCECPCRTHVVKDLFQGSMGPKGWVCSFNCTERDWRKVSVYDWSLVVLDWKEINGPNWKIWDFLFLLTF